MDHPRLCRRGGGEGDGVAELFEALDVAALRDHKLYTDLGADYFDRLDIERLQRHHVRRLEQLGYTVTLKPSPAA